MEFSRIFIPDKPIYIVGDIHGKFQELIGKLALLDIKDAIVICVGDLGIGFRDWEVKLRTSVSYLSDYLVRENIDFYSIRGNHDNPDFFLTPCSQFALNCWTIGDYINLVNSEHYIYCIGGATSVDGHLRQPEFNWWEGEGVVILKDVDTSRYTGVDTVITHVSPDITWPHDNKKSVEGKLGYEIPQEIWDRTQIERAYLSRFASHLVPAPKYWFYGHYHHYSNHLDKNGTTFICLPELEIRLLKPEFNF
jgi:hypothetical protein